MADVVSFRKEEPAGLLRVERNAPVLRITLSNPPANALSIAVMEALGDALDAAAADDAIRIVVLASTGKVFSAGHDLKEMTARREDADGGRAFFEKTMRMAADIMLKYNAELNRDHQIAQIRAMKVLACAGPTLEGKFGETELADYETAQEILLGAGLIDAPVDLSKAFTNSFVDAAPDDLRKIACEG